MNLKPRIRVPASAKTGDIIEVRTLVTHPMETGQRRTLDGQPIKRDIINAFTATFGGQPVFKAEFNSGISANPYLAFHLKVTGPGQLVMTWTDDNGVSVVEKADIAIA